MTHELSALRLRAAAVTALAMLLTFANLSLVCARVPSQQPAVPAVNEKVRALAEALKDSDAGVRYSAAEALVAIGPDAKAAVPALAEALKDSDAGVRGAAATALAAIGPDAQAAVPALVEALQDSDVNVARVAAEALDAIGLEASPSEARRDKSLTSAFPEPDRGADKLER